MGSTDCTVKVLHWVSGFWRKFQNEILIKEDLVGNPSLARWAKFNRLLTSCGSAGKESACYVGDLGSIPGLERSPGDRKGYPLQYSGLENYEWVTFIFHICKTGIYLVHSMIMKVNWVKKFGSIFEDFKVKIL